MLRHCGSPEAKRGTPTKAGLEAPDAVTQDLALGNMFAKLQWVRMPATVEGNTTEDSLMRQFNAGKDVDHQTSQVRIFNGPDGFGGYAEREETPDEARTRMSQDPSQLAKNDSTGILTKNSYHSAILRDPSNHRWVTAMDVAIGQAKSLDDKDWQDLWLAIADWKTPLEDISGLKKFNKGMTERGKELVTASCDYYSDGTFPSAKLVSLTPPSLVVSQTRAQRGDPPKPPPPPVFNWNFNGL